MAFEDSSQSGTSASRYHGEGIRPELELRELGAEYVPARRDTTTNFEVASVPAAVPVVAGVQTDPDSTLPLGNRVPPPNLDLVFDDPAEGEPGRDRMIVHGVWELLLAVALAGAGYLLYREQSAAFGADGIRQLLLATTILGLVAAASGLALRGGVPNLAVGAVAVASAVYFGQHAGDGLQRNVLVLLGLCAAVGLAQALVVVGLQVPAWAASLAVALGLFAWLGHQNTVRVTGGYDPVPDTYYWFGGLCAVSLLGTLVGLVPSVRRGLGRFRPVADPARRRGAIAGLIVVGVTIVSMIMAGAGGLLSVLVAGQAQPTDGLELTALALGAALLGGTSAFGRRGGILGTIFAAGLITVGLAYAAATNRAWSGAAFGAVAIGIGLAVTRLVEHYGRPSAGLRREVDDDWVPKVHALTPAGRSWQPAPTPSGGLWSSDDAWGSSIDSR